MSDLKKDFARKFLLLCAKGDSREAFQKYVSPEFKHHNAWFKGDAQTLMLAMEDAAKTHPNKIFEIKNIIAEGDFVAIHSWIRQTPDERGAVVMHICRFENDKIVELWDFGQAIQEDSPNENGMF